jgi:hypothetical protein
MVDSAGTHRVRPIATLTEEFGFGSRKLWRERVFFGSRKLWREREFSLAVESSGENEFSLAVESSGENEFSLAVESLRAFSPGLLALDLASLSAPKSRTSTRLRLLLRNRSNEGIASHPAGMHPHRDAPPGREGGVASLNVCGLSIALPHAEARRGARAPSAQTGEVQGE